MAISRAYLRIALLDGEGNVIFEAGQHDVEAGYVSPDSQYCAVLS